ncbi:Small RNA degrading nuclease 3 [Apostasia shenzhenica]|uniref:RNA exonuclease 4 n=1 Tax=Apostasia shenzhenica TaxID=1088818 RepID=A0A2H9ZQZ6_9ASPA|nr:Small RNA degrading nuclease 3 [Apostasia shenzhenica]
MAADRAAAAAAAAAALNPNWSKLQQNLKARRRLKPSSNPAHPDTETLPSSALSKRKERPGFKPAVPPSTNAVLIPTSDDFSLTEALAMDCEMVGVTSQGNKSALGRVTLVNTWGNVVFDEYVRPLEYVVDFRTNISGIRPRDLKKAKDLLTVQKKVAELIKGRILVGHALHNDLKVLLLSHPKKDTRDTTTYQLFLREGRRRALKDLAAEFLGVKIQQKEHCPIEDARAVMLIYQKFKKQFEKSIKPRAGFKKNLKKKRKKKSGDKMSTKLDVSNTS